MKTRQQNTTRFSLHIKHRNQKSIITSRSAVQLLLAKKRLYSNLYDITKQSLNYVGFSTTCDAGFGVFSGISSQKNLLPHSPQKRLPFVGVPHSPQNFGTLLTKMSQVTKKFHRSTSTFCLAFTPSPHSMLTFLCTGSPVS